MTIMQRTENLDSTERATSAVIGLSLSILALRGGSLLGRVLLGAAGAALMTRAATGYCAVKGALGADRVIPPDGVDLSSDDSFPASDPPASRLPDEPPSNAEAKWAAARGEGK